AGALEPGAPLPLIGRRRLAPVAGLGKLSPSKLVTWLISRLSWLVLANGSNFLSPLLRNKLTTKGNNVARWPCFLFFFLTRN
ncbi:hypothetical protein LINPERHAP1_LOCUS15986, partial [Linum perenne]